MPLLFADAAFPGVMVVVIFRRQRSVILARHGAFW